MKNGRHDSQPLLEIRDLSIGFADSRGVFLAADRLNLTLHAHQTLGLVGESGCGKSVTLRSILNLVPYPGEVIGGSVLWKGRDLRSFSRRELANIRGKAISMIFQDPTSCLNPVFTVGNQITETLRVKLDLTGRAAHERAVELLAHVGISSPEQRLKLYPHQLSRGMRQRIMIAIAIAAQPDLLLADEPTTALDVTIQDQILTLLAKLKAESGMSMILVSHDVGVIAQNCDLIAVMYAGRIVEAGTAHEVIHHPRHPYTQGLLAAVPKLEAAAQHQRLHAIPGQPPNLATPPAGCPFQPRCPFVKAECASIEVRLDRPLPDHGSACPIVN